MLCDQGGELSRTQSPSSTIRSEPDCLVSNRMRLWTSFGILFESWHHERFGNFNCAYAEWHIDPRLLNINTPHPFNLALRSSRKAR